MSKRARHRPSPDLQPGLDALTWAASRGLGAQIADESDLLAHRRRRRRILTLTGATACIAALGLFVASGLRQRMQLEPRPSSVVAAMSARQILPDGTIVDLKPGSEISASFTAGGGSDRRVALLRGEAHFEVAHNPARPFIVSAGTLQVRAIGTAFVIDLGRKNIEVVVSEGRVAVESPVASSDAPAAQQANEVAAGEKIVVPAAGSKSNPAPRVELMPSAVLAERLAWRIPRVEFSGTALAEAIPLFNRYGKIQITLGDPSLGQLQLSGVLRPDSTLSLIHLLKVEFGLEAELRGESEIVLWRSAERHRS